MSTTQMLKGLLEGCILEIINQQETYAYEITTKLGELGFGEISEGTIYPIMLRMQKNGLISATMRESSSGPKRKYYSLTEAGETALEEFVESWTQLRTAIERLLKGEGKYDR